MNTATTTTTIGSPMPSSSMRSKDIGMNQNQKKDSSQKDPMMSKLIELYKACPDGAPKTDRMIDELYDENCVFEDPMVCVSGIKLFKAQWHGLSFFIKSDEMDIHSTEVTSNMLKLDATHTFVFKPLGNTSTIRITTVCDLQNGRIRKHTDHWHMLKQPSIHEKVSGIPVIGWCYDAWRTVFGFSSSLFIGAIKPITSGSGSGAQK